MRGASPDAASLGAGRLVIGTDQAGKRFIQIERGAMADQPKRHRQMRGMSPFGLGQRAVEKFLARALNLRLAGKLPCPHVHKNNGKKLKRKRIARYLIVLNAGLLPR